MIPALLMLPLMFGVLQDGPVVTAPPVSAPSAQPQTTPVPAAAPTPAGRIEWTVTTDGESPASTDWTPQYSRSRAVADLQDAVPDWALNDPVRYAADQCRPQVRPATEEVEACMTRIERSVRNARAARQPTPRPNPLSNCRQEGERRADGSGGSATLICGTGGAAERALIERLRGD